MSSNLRGVLVQGSAFLFLIAQFTFQISACRPVILIGYSQISLLRSGKCKHSAVAVPSTNFQINPTIRCCIVRNNEVDVGKIVGMNKQVHFSKVERRLNATKSCLTAREDLVIKYVI